MKLGTTIIPVSMLVAALAFGATDARAEDAAGAEIAALTDYIINTLK